MVNVMLQDVMTLNEIIDAIDNKDYDTAKDKAIVMRDELQEEIDKAESDIDTQLQLEIESGWGK